MLKKCHGCGKLLEDGEFTIGSFCSKNPVCKECRNKYYRTSYTGTRERRLKKAHEERRKYPEYYWAKQTISNHRRRGYTVNITSKELTDLAYKTTHCKYCGIKLEFSYGEGKSLRITPTLDRTNNDSDLYINNIQIICHSCNTGKGEMTHDEFISYIREIAKRW